MKILGLGCCYLLSLGLLSACTQQIDEGEQLLDRAEISQPAASPANETPVVIPTELPPLASSGDQPPPEVNSLEDTTHIAAVDTPSEPRTLCGQDHVYENIRTSDYQIYICLNQNTQTDNKYRYIGIENKSGSQVILPAKTSGEYYAFSYEAIQGDITYKIATNPQSLQDARLVVTQGTQELLNQKIEQRELILD